MPSIFGESRWLPYLRPTGGVPAPFPATKDFITYMPSFKQPTFQERGALAAKAKQAALEKLRAKVPLDEATIAQRQAARLAREAAEAKAREEKRAARELETTARKARALEEAAQDESKAPALTEAERKAARDARYAARKSRVGKR
ncbi:MAG TPA: DUF6481 family protein [Sphingomonas sp.]|nr:DUF6481 family protein [Sphingomonas sp.]